MELKFSPVKPEIIAQFAEWRERVSRLGEPPRRIPIGVVIAPGLPLPMESDPITVETYGKGARLGIATCARCGSRMPLRECPHCRYRSDE